MTTLCKKTVDTIKRTIETGKIFDIEVFVIDRQGIRAKSDKSYIFLSETGNFDFLEFDSLCVSKITELNNRLNFIDKISGKDGYDVEVPSVRTLDSGDTIVNKLRLLSSGTAIEIGCSNAAKYKLPWKISESNLVSFNVNNDSSEVLNGFARVIQNKNRLLNIKGINGIIVATSCDDTGDNATHVLSTDPNFCEDKVDFSFVYNIGNVLPMLRGRMKTLFTLSVRGVLIVEINGITVMIFPEKNISLGTVEEE